MKSTIYHAINIESAKLRPDAPLPLPPHYQGGGQGTSPTSACTLNVLRLEHFRAKEAREHRGQVERSPCSSLRMELAPPFPSSCAPDMFVPPDTHTKLHYTSRCQRFARAGVEGHEEHDASRRQKPPPPQTFFRLYDEEDAEWAAGAGPAAHRGAPCRPCPMVQIVDVPVPQKGKELADILKLVDTQTPVEQVIAARKISNDSTQPRLLDTDLRRSQMAEQLVEVPTVLSYALLQQQTAKQIIDIPVPRRRRGLTQDRVQHRGLWSRMSTSCSWRPPRFSPKTEFVAAYCGAAR